MAVAAMSLLGFPPLVGFVGKFMLFVAGIEAGLLPLVLIACLNSAISAWYYLRLLGLPTLAQPSPSSETIVRRPVVWPRVAAVVTAVAIVAIPLFPDVLLPSSQTPPPTTPQAADGDLVSADDQPPDPE